MENYLYFRKQRPVQASVTLGSATQTCPAFSAADIGTVALNDNLNEIAAISITSAGGAGTGESSILFEPSAILPTVAYSGTALAIGTGTTHWINPANQAYANGVLVLDGHGTTGGYTLATGDVVTAYWKTGLETAFMYPVSALKCLKAVNDTKTSLMFASLKGDSTDDLVTITHDAGGFDALAKMINDACNAGARDGRLIKVIDMHDGQIVTLDGNNAAGISAFDYVPESGY